jgi:hypothetical protein
VSNLVDWQLPPPAVALGQKSALPGAVTKTVSVPTEAETPAFVSVASYFAHWRGHPTADRIKTIKNATVKRRNPTLVCKGGGGGAQTVKKVWTVSHFCRYVLQ